MQIHDLNTKTLTDPAYVAFDDGTDTYKVEFNDTVESAAQSAVAATDLTQNTVGFTSGDSLSPSGWTSVSQITTNSTLATLFNRISTMVKNVRYIWNLLGSSSFSNVASTLTGAIGNTALPTTAQTLSGAIAEHERDISTLNGNLPSKVFFGTAEYTGLGQGGYAGRATVNITFPSAMPNANYYASAELNAAYADFSQIVCYVFTKTTTGMVVMLVNNASGSGTVGGALRWVAIAK